MNRQEVSLLIDELKLVFDIVRLVDVTRTLECSIDSNGEITREPYECYAVWRKDRRCENCISSKSEPVLRDDMVSFGIPLFANIHLCGSVLTEVFFVMTVSQILYGKLPSVGTMILFCALLGVFAIGAPGVPGGTVMASLGLITGVLGFDATGTALMLTIFALQDSFGTACNVTGDGALTMILTGYARRHNIEQQTETIEF